MNRIFMTKLTIEKIRHLNKIDIPLSENSIKHLVLTGKNGSGKTSVLEALGTYLNSIATMVDLKETEKLINIYKMRLENMKEQKASDIEIAKAEENLTRKICDKQAIKRGIEIQLNVSGDDLRYVLEKGQFIIVYYKADRVFRASIPKHVEKVVLKDKYTITDMSREEFVRFEGNRSIGRNKLEIRQSETDKRVVYKFSGFAAQNF